MTQFSIRITTAIATGAVLLSSVAPAFAADTLVVTGNGKDSTSNVAVSENNSNVVSQTNTAVINNNTTVNTNTGNNKANDNLGDVHLTSGDANANVNVSNSANNNVANVPGCGSCSGGGTNVVIGQNLQGSTNNVGLSQNNSNVLFQTNAAQVANNTNINTNTGNNKANDNLGDVHMTSGATNANVNAKTSVNSNVATIGGGMGAGSVANPGVSAYILGNGKDTTNNIGLSLNNSAVVNQVNVADVANNTNVNANTGDNKANDNLGDVSIMSGKTNATVNVDTMANFNAASLDCGCAATDVFAKIGENLQDSTNNIALTRNNAREAFQTSVAAVNNNTVDNANTGNNEAMDNGSGYLNDPRVESGNTNTNVNEHTNANSNVIGPSLSLPNNAQLNFSWDMGSFGALWSWMMSN